MNIDQLRYSAEFSDIVVVVQKIEFKLHTFPLFLKSLFFKRRVGELGGPAPFRLDLSDSFPGGSEIFSLVADFFYSIEIFIDETNVVALRLAAAFLESEDLSQMVDRRIDELLEFHREKNDLTFPFALIQNSTEINRTLAEKCSIIDRALQSLIQSLTTGLGLQLSTVDRNNFSRLETDLFVRLVDLCPRESRIAVLPAAKHFLSVRVLDESDSPLLLSSDEEKRKIIDELVRVLTNEFEELPLVWLNSVHERAIELRCQSVEILHGYLIHAVLQSIDDENFFQQIPDETLAKIIEKIHPSKNEFIEDLEILEKLTNFTDQFIERIRERGELNNQRIAELVALSPKQQQSAHEILLEALQKTLQDEKSIELSDLQRDELINNIDFNEINEETIKSCRRDPSIGQKLVRESALSLCSQLRSQLEESRSQLKRVEAELRTYLSSSSNNTSSYRSRRLDSSSRFYWPRSRSYYSPVYDYLRNSSTLLRYENELDSDLYLPSRFYSKFY